MCRYLLTLGFALVVGAVSAGDATSAGSAVSPNEGDLASYSAMPKGPAGLRAAPTTWSSKASVRWQARWGGDARYIA